MAKASNKAKIHSESHFLKSETGGAEKFGQEPGKIMNRKKERRRNGRKRDARKD